MQKYRILKIFLILFILSFSILNSNAVEPVYVCGIAEGFPPYQFRNSKNKTDGFDADVVRLVFKRAGKKFVFRQMNWDDAVAYLYYSDNLDCVAGMEISDSRKKKFDFTTPYHHRKTVILVNADNDSIMDINDLAGRMVTGDRDSIIEKQLESMGLLKKIRIKETLGKENSMTLLKNHEFDAMITPKQVGLYLASKHDIKVRIIYESPETSPVAIAVKKGNTKMQKLLEDNLLNLMNDGTISKLHKKWLR